MNMGFNRITAWLFLACLAGFETSAAPFTGRITATLDRGGDQQTYLYTAGTNTARIERSNTGQPYAQNLVALDTGAVTLIYPHNRSFVRLPTASQKTPPAMTPPSSTGQLPPAPPTPGNIGPTNLPGIPAMPGMPAPPAIPAAGMAGGMPAMPMMPMPGETLELKATGEKTNLLGYACEKFEIRQRDEIMEIWATDQLIPFHAWQQNQPPRFGPQMIEEKWGDLVHAKKLFPLLAVLRFEMPTPPIGTATAPPGSERLRFEVKTIVPKKIENLDNSLFQPPADYQELQPLPF